MNWFVIYAIVCYIGGFFLTRELIKENPTEKTAIGAAFLASPIFGIFVIPMCVIMCATSIVGAILSIGIKDITDKEGIDEVERGGITLFKGPQHNQYYNPNMKS